MWNHQWHCLEMAENCVHKFGACKFFFTCHNFGRWLWMPSQNVLTHCSQSAWRSHRQCENFLNPGYKTWMFFLLFSAISCARIFWCIKPEHFQLTYQFDASTVFIQCSFSSELYRKVPWNWYYFGGRKIKFSKELDCSRWEKSGDKSCDWKKQMFQFATVAIICDNSKHHLCRLDSQCERREQRMLIANSPNWTSGVRRARFSRHKYCNLNGITKANMALGENTNNLWKEQKNFLNINFSPITEHQMAWIHWSRLHEFRPNYPLTVYTA